MKRLLKICLVVTLLTLFATASFAAKTIKLAVMEPLSGSFKDVGERYLEGVEYAAKVINEQGGINGKKVEIISIDDELKPDIAVRKATKVLLKENVKFFAGGVGSSVGGAMSDFAKKNNVLFFTYAMEAASLTGEKCNKNFFRAGTLNTDTHSYALAQWVAKKGYKKVFMVAQDYSFGHQGLEAFERKLKELDPKAEIVGKVLHPVGTKDFAPYVSQIISSGAEVVFTPNWGSDLSLLIKQAKPLGLKAKFAAYFLNDETAITAIGNDDAVIGSVAAENYMLSINTEANKQFIETFKKEKGYYPSWTRGKAYSAVMFWAEAMKKAGSEDVDAVIKAWEGLSYDGPAGTWTMRAYDHQVQMPVWVAEIVAENPYYEHAYVGPAEAMAAELVSVPVEKTGCGGL
jgi:branched-chain amino acid transport system substrate-binding protein